MEKKLVTEQKMKEVLLNGKNLDDYVVDLETARKIIKDAVLPFCK